MSIKNRITPDHIKVLVKNEIFVFGSNLSGLHRGGAAAAAMHWGAVTGVEEGCQGQTYAIPTMREGAFETLTIAEIKFYVVNFIKYAAQRPNYKFYVTEIGCGIAGLTPKEVAPLFFPTILVDNIYLPKKFWDVFAPLTVEVLTSMYNEQNNSTNWFKRILRSLF